MLDNIPQADLLNTYSFADTKMKQGSKSFFDQTNANPTFERSMREQKRKNDWDAEFMEHIVRKNRKMVRARTVIVASRMWHSLQPHRGKSA